MAGYSARPGFCESCGTAIAPIDWQKQQRNVACDPCALRRRQRWPDDTVDASARLRTCDGEAVKRRYSLADKITLALCFAGLAVDVAGIGYVFVDDVLKIIGVR